MARYGASTNTLAAEVDAIDVVTMAQRIIAFSSVGSAFMTFVPSSQGNRQGILGREAEMTWTSQNLDTAVSTAPDEQAYAPTSRAFECVGNIADAVISQYALADARTSGTPLDVQIRNAGARGYIKRYDALCAARYVERPTSTPDHLIGSASDSMSGGLLNQGIRLLIQAEAEPPFIFVAHLTKYEEIMAIPGMQEKIVVGGRNGGVDIGTGTPTSPVIVRGWNNVLTIALSSQIVSSSGYHNLMFSANPNTPGLINKWTPLETPNGLTPGKMLVDPWWNSARRAIEMNMTTQEVVQGYIGSATDDNDWMVDIVTA